ncbi:MAG: hypothetical protein A2Y40_08680 [Candidatus Margulisbacteria bacterium GWF2_35_9]|nr:MAG: hypothetical protein A2Y40_08680 [Candidatus Margulisbacteria bacterium GWF2_35_9]
MLFTSKTFALFLLTVFALYWFVFKRNLKGQNFVLLIASYSFYGWWDWRFLFLLFFISSSNYLICKRIQNHSQKKHQRILFLLGLIINIGSLVIFKYLNFFIDSANDIFSFFDANLYLATQKIILPVGISFYIFISISYIIDVYQSRLTAVRNYFDALLTFSFFPIILSGPIQRPISLLPQIQNKRLFNNNLAIDGLRQILWGLFSKIVIADRCAVTVNTIFSDSLQYSGSTLLLGIILFTIQIYADFAGYCNIAIGVGKLLGFKIMTNFAYPYFARNIKEFWRRWNISLSTWFRDYVFLPLAYTISKKIKSERFLMIKSEQLIYILSITITWILVGLWHGANNTFIIWGLIHGFSLLVYHNCIKHKDKILKRLNIQKNNFVVATLGTLTTIAIVMCSWVFFKSPSIHYALSYISGIFSLSIFSIPYFYGMKMALVTIILIVCFLIVEWFGRNNDYAIATLGLKWKQPFRWVIYYILIFAIIFLGGGEQKFIYFQF